MTTTNLPTMQTATQNVNISKSVIILKIKFDLDLSFAIKTLNYRMKDSSAMQ